MAKKLSPTASKEDLRAIRKAIELAKEKAANGELTEDQLEEALTRLQEKTLQAMKKGKKGKNEPKMASKGAIAQIKNAAECSIVADVAKAIVENTTTVDLDPYNARAKAINMVVEVLMKMEPSAAEKAATKMVKAIG